MRGVTFNTCNECGQPKTKEFGHSRYGNATMAKQLVIVAKIAQLGERIRAI